MSDATPAHVGHRPVEATALPLWATAKVRGRGTWAALVATLAIGVLADQSLRTGTFGLAASLTLVAVAVGVVIKAPLRRIESCLLAGAAVLLACFLTVRASPWLLWPDLLGALLLLGAAASFALRGSIFDAGAAEMTARSVQAAIQMFAGAGFVAHPVLGARGRIKHAAPAIRGVLIALPIAALIGGLLASADPVFASFFNLNIDFGTLALDVLFIAVGALAAAGLLRLAAAEPLERIDGPMWRLGATETLVVLAILDAVFAAFAVAQVLAATGAAADTLRAAGVTYADYARSGFFQLLWVSGITLAVLYLFSRIGNLTDRNAARAFMVLALCAIALTLMVDVVAFRRLSLYEEAYGFTMLRLYSHVFAAWLAVVFLLLAADFMGVWRARRWFAGATLATAVAVLVGLNVASPEAMVVAFNTSHAQTAHKIDGSYLAELSSDATQSLLSSRESLDPALRAQVTQAACGGARSYSPAWGAWNLADAQAADARRAGC